VRISVIEELLVKRRTLEGALADLLVKYQYEPSTNLARIIGLLGAEIEFRKQNRNAGTKRP
jgi:hypothetical protein